MSGCGNCPMVMCLEAGEQSRTRRKSLGFSHGFFIKSFLLVLRTLDSTWTRTPPSTKVCGLLLCKASLKALSCTETSQTFQVCSIGGFLTAVAHLLRQWEAFFQLIYILFSEKPNHFTDFPQMNANNFSVVCNGLYLTHSSPDSLFFLNHLV